MLGSNLLETPTAKIKWVSKSVFLPSHVVFLQVLVTAFPAIYGWVLVEATAQAAFIGINTVDMGPPTRAILEHMPIIQENYITLKHLLSAASTNFLAHATLISLL